MPHFTYITNLCFCQEIVQKAQEELAKQKEIIMGHDREIKSKSSEASKMRESSNDIQLKIKELEHNISKHKKDSADATARVNLLILYNMHLSSLCCML